MTNLEATNIIVNGFLEQYGAVFKTLEKIINLCPDNLWADKTTGPEIYKIIYHILYFADLYLRKTKEEREHFTPKFSHAENFGTSKENFHPREWARTLSKNEINEYLKEIRIIAQMRLSTLTIEQLIDESIFE